MTDLWTVYGGGGYTDTFKGIAKALQGFAGASRFFWKREEALLKTSLGYDFTYEDRTFPNPSDQIHSATQELEFLYKFNEHVEFKEKAQALENIEVFEDIRFNNDAEIKSMLNHHLALVAGFHLRFDNQPVAGFKKLDTVTDLSLSVSF